LGATPIFNIIGSANQPLLAYQAVAEAYPQGANRANENHFACEKLEFINIGADRTFHYERFINT
jgi:hypothetical protein